MSGGVYRRGSPGVNDSRSVGPMLYPMLVPHAAYPMLAPHAAYPYAAYTQAAYPHAGAPCCLHPCWRPTLAPLTGATPLFMACAAMATGIVAAPGGGMFDEGVDNLVGGRSFDDGLDHSTRDMG